MTSPDHCCGENRESNFCLDCGRQVVGSPLVQFLVYFKGPLRRCRNVEGIYSRRRSAKGQPPSQETRDRFARRIRRWEGWVAYLEDLIAKGHG